MSDAGQIALDGENPVNPYSLLEAVNDASDAVNTGWLLFLGVMSYLLITAAGVTHKDLFLSNDIPLPILQVQIDLARFFFFAPIILVLFHTGVVAQLVLLARKALEFDSALRLLEPTDRRNHPLRLEVSNFFFVQGIAGPERSKVMSAFLHGMSWLTLVMLPVLILLYMQVVFLPYHDVQITTANRIALFADIAMLASIGTFLARSENTFFTALGRTMRQHPITSIQTGAMFGLALMFSLFVATIPGERLDRITDAVRGRSGGPAQSSSAGYLGFMVPFLKPSADGSLFGLFYRNLVVTDTDLVVDSKVTGDEPSWNLRGRDLRFARLDRSDLHQMDFTGADLEGASFVQADLRKVIMGCGDLDRFLLSGDRAEAKCTDARGANFSRARLQDARMAGADLTGARLEQARLEGAALTHATMSGVDFTGAHLERADLTGGVSLYGANFLTASLQGADLTAARLMMADFSSAGMQGVILAHARLEGAILRDADLEGADLQSARLYSADFSRARVGMADFRGATLWRTLPPDADNSALTDMAPISARAPDQLDMTSLKDVIAKVEDLRLKSRLEEGLAPILKPQDGNSWAASADAKKWGDMQVAGTGNQEGFKARLTDGLTKLACRTLWANGAVAVGIAKRSLSASFKGDMPAINARIRSPDCPASRNIPPRFLTEFGQAADIARGQ